MTSIIFVVWEQKGQTYHVYINDLLNVYIQTTIKVDHFTFLYNMCLKKR